MKSIFFLCALLLVVLYFAAPVNAKENKQFDSVSSGTADATIKLLNKFPRPKFPINDPSTSKLTDYGKGVAFIVAPALAIAILSILVGILYGVFKLIRMCCMCCIGAKAKRRKNKGGKRTNPLQFKHVVRPTVAHVVFFVFLLTGALFALKNNAYFTGGMVDMLDTVGDLLDSTLNLGQTLINELGVLVKSIPSYLQQLLDTISGVPGLKRAVDQLGVDTNQTAGDIEGIKFQVNNMSSGNFTTLTDLKSKMESLSSSSAEIIANITDLIGQIDKNLNDVLNTTATSIAPREKQINDTTSELISTANNLMSTVKSTTDQFKTYLHQAESYDASRKQVLNVAFSLCIVTCLLIIPACIFKLKFIFNIFSAIAFIFLFLAFFSGSIHLLLGIVLNDACPVIDPYVQANIPDGDVGNVLRGCIRGDPILQSLNVTAFNLSSYFDFKSQFSSFTNFVDSFNFSAIDGYYADIETLYVYNLTASANNLTAADYGWNQTIIYDTLAALDNQTEPFGDYFDLDNYTLCDPSNYPEHVNQSIADTKNLLTFEIETNRTIYMQIETTKREMIETQKAMDAMLRNVTISQANYEGVKLNISIIRNSTIIKANAVIGDLQHEVDTFLNSGDCSYVGKDYHDLLGSLCEEIQPASDLLMLGQMLIGFSLIPLIIISEVLGKRTYFLKEHVITWTAILAYFRGASSEVKRVKKDKYDEDEDGDEEEGGRKKTLPSIGVASSYPDTDYNDTSYSVQSSTQTQYNNGAQTPFYDTDDQSVYPKSNAPYQPPITVPPHTLNYNNNFNNNFNNNYNDDESSSDSGSSSDSDSDDSASESRSTRLPPIQR